jgi:hypothetical protein
MYLMTRSKPCQQVAPMLTLNVAIKKRKKKKKKGKTITYRLKEERQ